MIKLIAAITMIVDHFGAFFLKPWTIQYQIARMIGRISMPLFGYCIARGFYFSKKHKTLKKYFRNLTIFALISQIPVCFVPYCLHEKWEFKNFYLNIGFTWLFSMFILLAISYIENNKEKPKNKEKIFATFFILALCIISFIIPVEYKLYGVLFPVMFYFFTFKTDNPLLCFLSSIVLYLIYIIRYNTEFFGKNNQIISIFSVFIIFLLQKNDNIIKLPKRFFYWFYPIHLAIFELIKYFFFIKK